MNLRKVDFFWINRDQRSFEWFVNLLSQLEIEQAELGGAMERYVEPSKSLILANGCVWCSFR